MVFRITPPRQSSPAEPELQEVAAPPPLEEMMAHPTEDHAATILRADSTLDDPVRADIWDRYYDAKDSAELAGNLSPLQIPDSTRRQLLDAKRITDHVPDPTEKVISALERMATLDPQVLELAEEHKSIAKTLIDAATKDDNA